MSSTASAASAPKAPLERQFTRIEGSDVFVSYPPKSSRKETTTSPSVILICGWMDARLVHLYKYTEQYHKLYPSATQILVRSYQSYYWSSQAAKTASVFPVIKLLHDSGIDPGSPAELSGLLVHASSNGGGIALTSIAREIAKTTQSSPAIPAQALVFDSLPGTNSLGIMVRAFTAPIRSAPVRAIASVVLGAVYIFATIWRHTVGALFSQGPTVFEQLHEGLNDPKLLPRHVPRVYLYSDIDELIPVECVEAHVAKVKRALVADGADPKAVKLVKFEGSKHVSHARHDPQRYWAAVVETWNASFRK